MNEPQEWTVEKQSTRNAWYLRSGQQLITSSPYYSMLQAAADAHNSELAASNSQLDEAGSHNAVADLELRELRQQLVDAHEVLKRIRLRHSNNDSTIREIDDALTKVKQ